MSCNGHPVDDVLVGATSLWPQTDRNLALIHPHHHHYFVQSRCFECCFEWYVEFRHLPFPSLNVGWLLSPLSKMGSFCSFLVGPLPHPPSMLVNFRIFFSRMVLLCLMPRIGSFCSFLEHKTHRPPVWPHHKNASPLLQVLPQGFSLSKSSLVCENVFSHNLYFIPNFLRNF